jgi:membrane-bound ClpP family serine protease
MCHVLLILPLIALPLFWVLPLSSAVFVYGAVVVVSGMIYAYAILAMRQPTQNGAEGMIGEPGHIVIDEFGKAHVQIRSELWDAVSAFPLREGERVRVIAAERTRLRVHQSDLKGMRAKQ